MDGTLVDSHAGIASAAAEAVLAVLPQVPVPDFRPWIGPPIGEIFRRALKIDDRDVIERLCLRYREAYDDRGCLNARLYDGVLDTLRHLEASGVVCCIVTNKPKLPTERMLSHLGIGGYFRHVVCPDSAQPRHPDKSAAIRALVGSVPLNADETVLVGDSTDDALAARECGVSFIAATYGYGGLAPSRLEKAAHITNLIQLLTQ